jgi:glycosyltransferase involved in cell wall biosynthesis
MKVLAFPRYDALGASSRVRLLQYLPRLAGGGVETRVKPLLGDVYLRRKYAGRAPWAQILAAYATRLRDLLQKDSSVDALWIEKELWPWAPAWLERLFWGRVPVALDFDDAIFHNYDLHPNPVVRRLYGRKIDSLMRHASLVLAGNDYLAARARDAGATRVEVLPTVVDLDRYALATRPPADPSAPVVIGWIGSPATAAYLAQLAVPLAALAARRPIELRVIGANATIPGVRTVHVPWTEAGEVAALQACDIGVMPLADSPWERGKCGYKLIQYMACGLPVVASPVGANGVIVREGVDGFLASTAQQWEDALARLAADPALRTRLGLSGRARVETEYSLQANTSRLVDGLKTLARRAA